MSDSQTTRDKGPRPDTYPVEARTPANGPWAGMPGTDIPEYADLTIKPLPPGCPLDRMLTKWKPGNFLSITYRGQSLVFRLAQAGEISSKDLPENTYVAPPPPPEPPCSPCATPSECCSRPETDEERIERVAQEEAKYIIEREKVLQRRQQIVEAAFPPKATRKPAPKKPRAPKPKK